MDDIHHLYHNEFGIAFRWKREVSRKGFNKIQLIFRDTGFNLNPDEIELFSKCVKSAKKMPACNCTTKNDSCKNILLATPSAHIDLAVNKQELFMIDDLIKGTLFQINLDGLLNKL